MLRRLKTSVSASTFQVGPGFAASLKSLDGELRVFVRRSQACNKAPENQRSVGSTHTTAVQNIRGANKKTRTSYGAHMEAITVEIGRRICCCTRQRTTTLAGREPSCAVSEEIHRNCFHVALTSESGRISSITRATTPCKCTRRQEGNNLAGKTTALIGT